LQGSGEDEGNMGGSGESEKVRAVLVDLDWAAQAIVGRYPTTLSTALILSKELAPLYTLEVFRNKCVV
jgi:hypothetical protein